MDSLPIDEILPSVVEAFRQAPTVLVKASPGSGKTTRIPVELLKALPASEKILVLEPRRLAAKWAALRVADELGEPVGQTVGYQFRTETKSSPKTRILFLTEGTFVRIVQKDPELRGVGAVILDEFHERHLQTDLALAWTEYLRSQRGVKAKLVILSATLDTTRLRDFLPGARELELNRPLYPVTLEHKPGGGSLEQMVERAARSLANRSGDTLVFLPGLGDIRRCGDGLARLARETGWAVCPLHGELDRAEQDRAMKRLAQKKIILATNIAESSVTIDGVSSVIDSGLHRQAGFSHWSGIGSLKTKPISQASAIQRMGRAGRQGPGHCIRLFTDESFRQRPAFDLPEILRADLSEMVFAFLASGIPIDAVRFLDPPQPSVISASMVLLNEMGAIDSMGRLTQVGKAMADFPLHPRLSRILLSSQGRPHQEKVVQLVAALSEGRLPDGDVSTLPENSSDSYRLRKARERLERTLGKSPPLSVSPSDSLTTGILSGFVDRVARIKKVEPHAALLVFAEGGEAKILRPQHLISGQWVTVLEAQENERWGRRETIVNSYLPVSEEDLASLDTPLLQSVSDFRWDREKRRVVSRNALLFGKLALEERVEPAPPSLGAAEIVLREALSLTPELAARLSLPEFIRLFGGLCDLEKLESVVARAQIALGQPKWDLWSLCRELFSQFSSAAELKSADWLSLWWGALAGGEDGRWRTQLPEAIELPSGRRATIQYRLDREPFMESRLQDFFGLAATPQVMGRPLLLHLLAPNHRAVQVTNDLAGFWKRTYPEVRRELSRRYPRHPWPENPLEKPKKGDTRKPR
ncbi:MAG: ATP-dependent helicase HrpB [Deltaproteobacteria bacterium]|nr:ATP-dependent helicase HrpB [Deltaproteobacteria bacterium]MBI3293387.1 ATP-dependent helicase HrpB [Deltaproteobacteria bacterium]